MRGVSFGMRFIAMLLSDEATAAGTGPGTSDRSRWPNNLAKELAKGWDFYTTEDELSESRCSDWPGAWRRSLTHIHTPLT